MIYESYFCVFGYYERKGFSQVFNSIRYKPIISLKKYLFNCFCCPYLFYLPILYLLNVYATPFFVKITAQASFDMQTSTGFADFTHFADEGSAASIVSPTNYL